MHRLLMKKLGEVNVHSWGGKIWICCLVILAFFAGLYFSSFSIKEMQTAEMAMHTGQDTEKAVCLQITLTPDDSVDFITIPKEKLGGHFDEEITYYDVTNVMIDINGESKKLEEAIRDGEITVEAIYAYARMDARKGNCTESFESKNGLAKFTYRYPDFDLRLVYDVYETPDGESHLIQDIGIYRANADVLTRYTDDTGKWIDREDWGVMFEVVEATPTGLVLN